MSRAVRFAAGLVLGCIAATAVQACGENELVYPVALGTYTLNAGSAAEPDLGSATLIVEPNTVTLEYLDDTGQSGSVVWKIVGGEPVAID